MTDAEREQVEKDRRQREDELLLILLLLLGGASREAVVAEDVQRRWLGSQLGRPASPQTFRRIVMRDAPREIAESMAEAHRDAFRIHGGAATPPSVPELVRQYTATAVEAVEAMLETITAAIVELGGNILEALRITGYDVTHTRGIELGAERNIVTASNAGIIDGAVYQPGAPPLTGLRHVSVVDDRTTEICTERAGLQLPIGHPYWLSNFVSLHWNCRSIIEPLYGAFQVSTVLPTTAPMPGFGHAPPTVLAILEAAARRNVA